MASTKTKPVGQKEDEYNRIVAAMKNIPTQLKKLKKEKNHTPTHRDLSNISNSQTIRSSQPISKK